MQQTIGIIGGAGWLGRALSRFLHEKAGLRAEQLIRSYRSQKCEDNIPCIWTQDNAQLVEKSDIIVLSVRPQDFPALTITAPDKLFISLMAGVTMDEIAAKTGAKRIARAAMNAAAELAQSYTPFFVRSEQSDDAALIRAILATCGQVDGVLSEQQIDYFLALTGTGPAFPSLFAEAMMKHAIAKGIDPAIAMRAVNQLLVGTAALIARNEPSPTQTVQAFIDYRGSTAAGLVAMREAGIDGVVARGLDASLNHFPTPA